MQFLIQLHDNVSKISTNIFLIYHPHYKKKPEMTEFAHTLSLLRLLFKLLLLPNDPSNCVVKYNTYHLHYKE